MASSALKQSSVKRVQYFMREERLNTADSAISSEVHMPVQLYIARNGRPMERKRERVRTVQYMQQQQQSVEKKRARLGLCWVE